MKRPIIKIVLYKNLINFHLFLSGAAVRRRASPPPRTVVIPEGTRIYIETPGNQVLTGILYHEPVNFAAEVMIRNHEDASLHTNLEPFHHNSNHISSEYRCYIPFANRQFLTSLLQPYIPGPNNVFEKMSIMVQIPSHHVFLVGQLKRGVGPLPAWIPQ